MGQRICRFISGHSHGSCLVPVILCLALVGCSYNPFSTTTNQREPTVTPAPDTTAPTNAMAEYVFKVQVPDSTLPNVDVHLDVLDEVTGLALNPISHKMQPVGNFQYEVNLVFAVGTTVKYRYSYEGNPPVAEYNAAGQPVRYRMAHIDGPGEVDDIVAAWDGLPYSGPKGRISGVASDQTSLKGIPDLLITAGGTSTVTASDGSFLLENLSPGTHNLVAYAIDGSHEPFQQGAVVAGDSTTPAPLSLNPSTRVNVQFIVTIPQENILNLPVRLAGNLYSTGNTFADLRGGVSTIASRMPLLTPTQDGRYSITLSLPAGLDFQYKYTLGDGFWNAEHVTNGAFRLREIIVPNHDAVIEDSVTTWRSGNIAPISFEVKVPPVTPTEDYVSLQLNPYGWTESLPMWSLGDNRWLYVLYSPLDLVGSLSYRFCRNDQCGVTDDSLTPGPDAVGVPVQAGTTSQTIQTEVKGWFGLTPDITVSVSSPSTDVNPRGTGFIGGMELQPVYHPSWQTRYPVVFSDLRQSGSNWVVLDPTWTFTSALPPVLEPVPGQDPLWSDLLSTIPQATGQGINVALYPSIHTDVHMDEWWSSAPRDYSWWELWFGRYQQFLTHFADLAAASGAQALIVGGPWIEPALPDGVLADGSPSNVPTDAETRWRDLLTEVRGRFSGKLIWAANYPEGIQTPPAFIDLVDEVYLLWSAPIANQSNPAELDLENDLAVEMDSDVYTFANSTGKPIILAIGYPSTQLSATGCIPSSDAGCEPLDVLNQPNPPVSMVELDVQQQADIYNAFLAVVNQRDWISGFISRGYYPVTALQDKSLSVHGKPAGDILEYWFPRLVSSQTQ